MKFTIYLLIICALAVFYGCSSSPDGLKQVTLEIYNSQDLLQSYTINENQDGNILPVSADGTDIGEVEIGLFSYVGFDPDVVLKRFVFYARKGGFYTYYQKGYDGDTIRYDYSLDFDPVDDSLVCGMIFSPMEGPIGLVMGDIMQDTVCILSDFYTNRGGQFQIDIPFGEYTLVIGSPVEETESFIVDSYYKDYYYDCFQYTYKPNIYLYPTETETLSVSIDFPLGGHVTVSDPAYPLEWQDIVVEPSGMVDEKHEYLFYEAIHPKVFQRQEGWIVSGDSLQAFFEENLYSYGFRGREIEDFTEFWMPRLYDGRDYIIYPQAKDILDTVTPINCSMQPDNYMRLTYLIGEFTDASVIPEKPEIPDFSRNGFVLTEWGVSFDDNLGSKIAENR